MNVTLLGLLVLLLGAPGLAILGVASHQGVIALQIAWLLGLCVFWLRTLLLWRVQHSKEAKRKHLWQIVVAASRGGFKSTALALLMPVIGYWGADVMQLLPVWGRWALFCAVLLLGGVWLWRSEHLKTLNLDVLKRLLGREARSKYLTPLGHVLWLLVALLWASPSLTGKQVLERAARDVGFQPRVETLQWIDEPYQGLRTAFTTARAVALVEVDGISDVFLLRFGLSHEGQPARLDAAYNLSNTAAAAEGHLVAYRKWAVWTIESQGQTKHLEIADLRGEPAGKFDTLSRIQRGITNLQQTGQWRGVGRSGLSFDKPVGSLSPTIEEGTLMVHGQAVDLSLELGRQPEAEALGGAVNFWTVPPVRPGALIPWAVDRLRAVSFIGSDGMQWLKGWAFKAEEQLQEIENQVIGIDPDETISEELGALLGQLPLAEGGKIPGWPPAAVPPLMKAALAGEGKWVSLAADMQPKELADQPSPFVFTFIRTDPELAYIQTSITLWDPRRIRLHIVAGTEEPKSMTGELGSGTIPRDPKLLSRLAGAFNGAFQAVHGEFGMMEATKLLLPPKPYAATVTTDRQGVAGFGTWPASSEVPKEYYSLRQNLTPLVVDSTLNPYQRTWWGGVPEGWTAETRTVRSGLCLTREGYLAYFYSPGITPEALGKAMLQARCQYGIHLDMNAGHTGFEFYRVGQRKDLPKLGRRLDRMWEAKGRVPGTGDLEFFSRLMVRKMPLMHFPRYIHTTSRDFFYLTRRELLPARALTTLSKQHPDDGKWRVLDLGAGQYPPAMALTSLHVPSDAEAKTTTDNPAERYVVTRLDPKQLAPASIHSARLGLLLPTQSEELKLWVKDGIVEIGAEVPEGALVLGGGSNRFGKSSSALMCVDEHGMLAIVQPQKESGYGEWLLSVERLLRCENTLYFDSAPQLLVEDEQRQAAKDNPQVKWFAQQPQLGVKRIFTDTPILKPSEWALAQRRRVEMP